MSLTKTKLKDHLQAMPITSEEKRMWYKLGFWVESPRHQDVSRVCLMDGAGNTIEISPIMAGNLRRSFLEWWEVEKTHPREADPSATVRRDPFEQLEATRQA